MPNLIKVIKVIKRPPLTNAKLTLQRQNRGAICLCASDITADP